MAKIVYEPVPPLAESVDAKLALLCRILVTVERLLEDAVTDLDEYVIAAMHDEYITARARDEGLALEADERGCPLVLQDVREAFGLEERYWDLEGRFPDILRKWLFVAVYSFVEETLLTICHQEEHEGERRGRPLSRSVKDFKKRDLLGQSKKYLKEVAGFSDFPAGSVEWNEIYGYYRRLRNCIVHNGGKLKGLKPRDDRELERYIRCKSSLRCLGSDRVVFEKGFCEEVLQTTRSFFGQLFRALDERRLVSEL